MAQQNVSSRTHLKQKDKEGFKIKIEYEVNMKQKKSELTNLAKVINIILGQKL